MNIQIEMMLYIQLSILHFMQGQYRTSISWLNKALHNDTFRARADLQSFIRIYNLILHYELGNHDVLEYLARSVYRYLMKRDQLYKYEQEILSFIRHSNTQDSGKMISHFTILRNNLEKIVSDPFEKRMLEFFDIFSWLDSKITGRPFAEIVRKKAEEEKIKFMES